MPKDYSPVKITESRLGMKDVGQRISPERIGAFIDRVFAPEQPSERVELAEPDIVTA